MINKQRYGIRKYKIGAASIALGTIVVIGVNENNEAHASEIQMQHSSNESSESNVQNNAEPQQHNAPVETLKETHVDTNQQIIDEQKQQTIQQNEESVQSEEISVPKEPIDQNNETNTSKTEVENKEQSIAPKTTTSSNVQPRATQAPRTISSEKQVNSGHQLLRLALKEKESTAQDVSSKIKVNKSTITTQDELKKVNSHQAGKVTVDYDLKIGNDIKNGDYFEIKFSDNVDTNGIGTKKIMPEIKEGNIVIATGLIVNSSTVRYTFTESVSRFDYIDATLSINLYFRPSVVLDNGKQTVTSTLGSDKVNDDFEVEYLEGEVNKKNININGRIDKLNKEKGTITQITYINTKKIEMKSIAITGKVTKGSIKDNNLPSIKLYEYNGEKALSKSINIDVNDKNFVDVTNIHKEIIHLNEDGTYVLLFNFTTSKTYVVKYEAKYDNKSSDINFQTQLVDNLNYDSSLIHWNNGVQFYKNNASGKGNLNPIVDKGPEIKIDFELPNENGKDKDIIVEISKETNPADEYYDTDNKIFNNNHVVETDDLSDITGGEINQNNNVVVIEDVTDPTGGKIDYNSDHVELDENSNPGGGQIDYNSNHVELDENSNPGGGKLDYNSNTVDLEEDSNPGGGKLDYNTNIIDIDEDTNYGEEDIYHNTDIIDFDEDTATGVVTGAISDHTTIEDTMEYTKDNNLIELVDDNTLPPAITGEAEGPINEIDENHKVEIIEITTPIGEEGHIQGKVEETTENKLINFEEETGSGEIRGEITDVIEEIDENYKVEIIDITMPIGEEGRVKGKIEETIENKLINFEEETGTGEIRGEITDVIEEIDEIHQIEIIDITMPIGEEGSVNGTVEETVENNVIDFDTESGSGTIHGNITGIVEEIDDNHFIDIEHGLDSENGSIDINDTVEDTMIDKPSIDNRTENPVIIVENTIPKNNGSVKGIIEELDITKVVSPVIIQKDKKNKTQGAKNKNVGAEKKARIGNVASQNNKDLKIKDEKKIKYNTNTQGCDTGHACVVNVKPHFEPISTVPHTSNDAKTQHETLPNTGQNNNEKAVIFGGLLSLLGLSLLRRKGKKTLD